MTARHHSLPFWLDVPEDDHHQIKKALAAKGVNARGWRLYADYGDALFDALGDSWIRHDYPLTSIEKAVALLRLLAACEMDVPPPRALIASIRDWQLPRERLGAIPPPFLRAAWKACAEAEYAQPDNPGALADFVREHIVPAARWYFESGLPLDEDPNRLNAGWTHVERRYREWRREQARHLEATAPAPAQWPLFVPAIEFDGLRFAALGSGVALEAEGVEMMHCVGDYGERCRSQMLRIYAVSEKKSGVRVATLSVMEVSPGYWDIDQLKGRYNAPVPQRVAMAAQAVTRALEDAYAMLPAARHEMDGCRSKRRRVIDEFDDFPF